MFDLIDAALFFLAAGNYHGKENIVSWTLFSVGVLIVGGYLGKVV